MNSHKEFENNAKEDYVWSDYIRLEALPLDRSTIERAREAGIGELLLKLSAGVSAAVEQLETSEYNYDGMAKIVGAVQKSITPFQKRYHGPNIVIGSFISPNTGALNMVYLSEYGIILETMDPVNGKEVRDSDPTEIWRYLYWPSKIVENTVSIFIAVAEKHKAIKDDWIHSFQKFKDLCLDVGND